MLGGKKRILVVDDEETLREGLKIYLEQEGYSVESADSAEQALRLDLVDFDLILLDIMMGKISGTVFASKLKEDPMTAEIPIIFLTAKDRDDDMIEGLKLGADDYIIKPFSIKNVLARIEAVLRRCNTNKKADRSWGIVCDRRSLICTIDGKPIKLPKKEFEILALFLENPGRIFTRDELMQKVWPDNVVVADRSIDVHIARIRNKIVPYGKYIISRSGYGYGWQD
ncbi:MAG: response regulator transcription factor [Paramuribaculum sp.]|nr:response regulator transcription factor [Paramuribaculum sp.]